MSTTKLRLNPNDECSFCRTKGHPRTIKEGPKIIMVCPELCGTCWASYGKCTNKNDLGKGKTGCGNFNPNKFVPSQQQRNLSVRKEQTQPEPVHKEEIPKSNPSQSRFSCLDEDNTPLPIKKEVVEDFPALSTKTSMKQNTVALSFAKVVSTPAPEKPVKPPCVIISRESSELKNASIDHLKNIKIQSFIDKTTIEMGGLTPPGHEQQESDFINYIKYQLQAWSHEDFSFILKEVDIMCEETQRLWDGYCHEISK